MTATTAKTARTAEDGQRWDRPIPPQLKAHGGGDHRLPSAVAAVTGILTRPRPAGLSRGLTRTKKGRPHPDSLQLEPFLRPYLSRRRTTLAIHFGHYLSISPRCFSFLGKFLFFSPSFRSSYVKSAAVFRSLLQVAVARRLRSPRCNPRRSVDARPAEASAGALCSFPGTSSTRCQAPPRTDDGDSGGDNQVAAAAAGGVGRCGGAAGGYLPSSSETGKTESANPGKGAPARCQPQSPGRRAGS